MKITADQLRQFGIVDEIVPEPPGGAHIDREALFRSLDASSTRSSRSCAPSLRPP